MQFRKSVSSAINKPTCVLLACMLCLIVHPGQGRCQEQESDAPLNFTLYWENDTLTGTDRDYTNGLKLTWSSPYTEVQQENGGVTGWIMEHLPLVNNPDARRATSISLGQNIYTPEDTERADVVEDERPYAGYTYLGLGYHSQQNDRRVVWELDVGVVGPLSQGEALNKYVHDRLDFERARGWDNQLKNELGIEAIIETKWRMWQMQSGNGLGADFLTHMGGSVGNIAIHVNTGCELRVGWFIPNDFGTCPIRPGCDSAMNMDGHVNGFGRVGLATYFFFAVDGRLVIRDIFLDGNTFSDSHSVDKELLVADFMAGFAIRYRRLRISFAHVKRTKEFKEQDESHAFGAVSISYAF